MSGARGGTEAEVIVAGGGPAGASFALRLARAGRDVLLFERAPAFPRVKPCGESINPGALAELDALGVLNPVLALPHATIGGWRIHPQRGKPFEARFPDPAFGVCMDRGLFDAELLNAARDAGVRVVLNSRVVDVEVEAGRVVGVRLGPGTRAGARVVVGADGLRSIVNRRLGLLRRGPVLRKLALTAHARLDRWRASDLGELHLLPWGCVGVVPIDSADANVVMVLDRFAAMSLAGDPKGYFDRVLDTLPSLAGMTRVSQVSATGPFDFPVQRLVTDGALVVGDAAGYYDPFTGQGIFRALRGARLAAAVVERALTTGDASRAALLPYERAHHAAFDSGVRLQHLVEFGVARPQVFAVAATLLRAWPALADRLVAVIGDARPLRSVSCPPRRATRR